MSKPILLLAACLAITWSASTPAQSADIQSGEITEALVANPRAGAEVRRALPEIGGRDFALLLSDRFHLLKGVREEEFVRDAGWLIDTDLVRDGKFSYADYRQEKDGPQVASGEIQIRQQGRIPAARSRRSAISSSEPTTVIDGTQISTTATRPRSRSSSAIRATR